MRVEQGETLNVNGDTAAGAIAAALRADRMLLLTDVAGVKDASGRVLPELSAAQVRQMIRDGTILGGMIPKTETALEALEGGARAVVIPRWSGAQRLPAGALHRGPGRARSSGG